MHLLVQCTYTHIYINICYDICMYTHIALWLSTFKNLILHSASFLFVYIKLIHGVLCWTSSKIVTVTKPPQTVTTDKHNQIQPRVYL